jgi:5-methylcytosine-specific restriction endonuclease McrA
MDVDGIDGMMDRKRRFWVGGFLEPNCELCERPTPDQYLEEHHVVPISKGGKKLEKVKLCNACHGQLHQMFENRELKTMTFEELRSQPKVWAWIKWIRKKKDFVVCLKRKK